VPQGLLTRASIGQQIQDWVKEARDALEFFNDRQAHYWALLANQAAQKQVEADMARMQAEETRRAEEARIAAEAEWEFLGMHGRLGAIEFGNAFAIEWAGYWDRGEATWGGAVFMSGDALSFGQYYTDEDRGEMYGYYASQGLGDYYIAGGITGVVTTTAVTALGTGGASTFTVGTGASANLVRTAYAVRTTAGAIMVAESGYSGYQAGAALGEVANGGEWTTDTSLKVGVFAISMGGPVLGRGLGRLRSFRAPPTAGGALYGDSGSNLNRLLVPAQGTKWYQFKLRHVIKQLEAGDVPVSLNRGLTPVFRQMGKITNATGREVGLFSKNGSSYLRLGTYNEVAMPTNAFHWAHTHPSGNLRPSGADIAALRAMGQRTHWIVGREGSCQMIAENLLR
jgi:hypothetical protein